MNYKYTLEKYKDRYSKHSCPACGKARRFTRYIDTDTGEYLHPDVGRCDREVKCGYHKKPKEYFEENPNSKPQNPKPANRSPFRKNPFLKKQDTTRVVAKNATMKQPPETQHTLRETASSLAVTGNEQHQPSPLTTYDSSLTTTLTDYEHNHLVQYLIGRLGHDAVQGLLEKYRIGTHHHWQGSTVFWYADVQQRICAGKVMLYNPHTGKRVKEPFPHVTWMHTLLGIEGFERKACFFGEHLLQNNNLPVCIVESEKTALIAAHHLPQSIWLATGGIGSLNVAHCKQVLHNRKITLFPDTGGYDKWQSVAAQLPRCNISRLLDYYHSFDSDDLADLLCA